MAHKKINWFPVHLPFFKGSDMGLRWSTKMAGSKKYFSKFETNMD
jgi:hypothetical protein